jgi:hypothetical protein
VNVTVKVQDAPPPAIEPLAAEQDPAPEFVIEKSPEFPPLTEGLILVAVATELFVSVNVTGELDEPTLTDPKLSGAGERITPNGSF